jgi:murein L,D-transpeptidase YafK
MSAARPALIGAVVAVGLALAGCKSEQAPTARSIQSLNPELVSLMTEKGMSKQDPILLRIFKEESKAEVWKKRKADGRYALLKSYDICRFSGKLGPKLKEGDKQAPEGFYAVTPAQMNPKSSYYLSFNMGFPNAYDRSLGRTGRHVMVHGDCLSAGCYAMTDPQIAEIYALAREAFAGGQKAFQVQALPFRMTPQNMARRRNNSNMAFWKNLKQGSDHFEVAKLEPKVDVCGKKYVFNASAGPFSTFEPTAQCPSYQTQPEIAKAVAAKERVDNILIAQLSKTEAPAPEYIAQNGRMRRSLDEPIIQVASAPVAPETTAALGPTMGDAGGERPAATTVALRSKATPEEVRQTGALALSAPDAAKPAEGNLFTRLLRSEERPAAPAAAPAPTAVAETTPAPSAPRPATAVARREISPQQPVMATSVSSGPTTTGSAGATSKLRGWISGVGGLFGGGSAAPAADPGVISPPEAPAAEAAKTRQRSARMPDEFLPAKPDPRVTSAFAAFD